MIIKDWQSNTDYDNKKDERNGLKDIYHYQIHPEMLPYVGKKYINAKILLVGESHYLCTKINECPEYKCYKDYAEQEWYNKEVPNDFPNKHYFNTRHVVHNFLVERRSRAHSMFRNPAKGIIDALDLKNVTDSEAFSACAFMNYFQRPAMCYGKSIEHTEDDRKNSYEVFKNCKEILKPDITIFLSKKAYSIYTESAGGKADDVYCVMHPTCSHWNRMNGRDRFISIIRDSTQKNVLKIDSSVFDKSQKISYDKIFPNKYTTVRRKRFDVNNTLVQVRGAHNSINEIVIYFISNDVRYGIGFVVRYGYIWIWDYDNKRYVNEEELNENQIIKDNYNDFKKWIEELQ